MAAETSLRLSGRNAALDLDIILPIGPRAMLASVKYAQAKPSAMIVTANATGVLGWSSASPCSAGTSQMPSEPDPTSRSEA